MLAAYLLFALFAQLGHHEGWTSHHAPHGDVDPDDLALFGLLDQVVADLRGRLWRQVGVLHAA